MLLGLFSASAQDEPVLHWARTYGSTGHESAAALVRDAEGNIYTAGPFNGTVDFDPGPGTFNLTQTGNSMDAYVLKLDPQGNFLWVKRMGGADANLFTHMLIAPNGDIILGGNYNGTVDFNPGTGTANLTSTTMLLYPFRSFDAVVVRLDANGNFIWAKSFGGTQADSISAMTLDQDGNLVISGLFGESGDFDPGSGVSTLTATGMFSAFVLKLDANGNYLWAKSLGAETDARVSCLTTNSDNDIILAGNYVGEFDLDSSGEYILESGPTDQFNQSFYQGFAARLNTDGNVEWAGKFGGQYPTLTDAVLLDPSGNIYLSGTFSGVVDIAPGPTEHILNPGVTEQNLPRNSIYLTKLDSQGEFSWARSFVSSFGQPRHLKWSNDGLIVAGDFELNFPIDGFPLVSQGESDMFISRFDADGNATWATSFGGENNDELSGISFDESGIFVLSGHFDTAADLDPTAGSYPATSNGWTDAFVVQIGPEALATPEASVKGNFLIYPNPSAGKVHFQFPNPGENGKLSVFNLLGQKVREVEQSGNFVEMQLPSGQYIATFSDHRGTHSRKFIVN